MSMSRNRGKGSGKRCRKPATITATGPWGQISKLPAPVMEKSPGYERGSTRAPLRLLGLSSMLRWSLFIHGSLWDHNYFMGLHLFTYLFNRCLINTYYVPGCWSDN